MLDHQLFEYFLSFLLAFSIAFVISPRILIMLRKLNFGQEIRQEGPQSHLSKAGTPTMGGVVFIIAIIASTLILNFRAFSKVYLFLLYLLLFALVGFMDDYVKVINKRNLGLTSKQKLLVQIVFALILSVLTLKNSAWDTNIIVPFTSYRIKLGMFYIPFTVLTIVATTNSVNLTDGLDGLASSVTSIAMLALGIIAMNMSFISESMFAFAVTGGCLGFLRINAYPAKSFMGDTGSLFLGFTLSVVSMNATIKSAAALAVFIPIITLGIPIFDTTFAIIRRAKNNQPIMQADKGHLHHRLLNKGLSQKQTVLILYMMSVLLGLSAYFIAETGRRFSIFILATDVVLIIFVIIKFKILKKG